MTQLAVRELTPYLLPDWLAFFDHDAFADNPDWGLAVAEAYPRTNATDDAHNYHGPLALYLEAGFTVFRECEGFVIVRKDLAL